MEDALEEQRLGVELPAKKGRQSAGQKRLARLVALSKWNWVEEEEEEEETSSARCTCA